MNRKPVIGLNCSYKHDEKYAVRESFIPERYYDSVAAAGGLPILLPPLDNGGDIKELLRLCDGLLLIGGDDINPARYGQERHAKTCLILPRREEFDFALVGAALESRLPILAICQGCQVMNVALGGTLHQHVPDVYGEDVPHFRPDEMRRKGGERMHRIRIEKGSLLHETVGAETLEVNSSHHQAADRPGEGLRVSARSADGVAEALEWKDPGGRPFMLAVQWHPERISSVKEQMLLFEALARAASRYGETAGREKARAGHRP